MTNRDWTGDTRSTFVTLGANSHTDHKYEENSFYATDPHTLEIFLDKLAEDGIFLENNIWECAAGKGTLSDVLKTRGYNVYSSDLIKRDYDDLVESDFLADDNKIPFDKPCTILTNPPYKFALEFVKQGLKLQEENGLVIMLLKIQFLEGKERRDFFKENPPKYVYVNSERQACYINGDFSEKKGSAVCYCWYVWEKGFKGEPVVRWI